MLGSAVHASSSKGIARVEYCPDNTCEAFELRGSGAAQRLQEFAAVYFYGVSRYVYLEAVQQQEPPPVVAEVLIKLRPVCPQSEPRLAAQCAAAHLAKAHPIRGSFVRFDEGRRTSIALSVRQAVRAAR